MYTPERNEMEELWFVWDYKVWLFTNWVIGIRLWNLSDDWKKEYKFFIWWEVEVFPRSKQDFENLIYLFTKP